MKAKLFFLKLKIEKWIKNKLWSRYNIFCLALCPFSLVYYAIYLIKFYLDRRKQKSFDIPIICIGNLQVGGGGKTPLVLGLAKYFKECGVRVAVVSRGYGRKSPISSYVLVNSANSAAEVGDEPLLFAPYVPTYVAEKREIAVQAAQNDGIEIILFDDGFQNQTVYKDFSILVVDGQYNDNGFVIPAGPLRETVSFGLKRAHAIVVVNPNKDNNSRLHAKHRSHRIPIFNAKSIVSQPKQYAGRSFIALVGIAVPQKFLQSCREINANIIEVYEFSDHYLYTNQDIKPIYEKSVLNNCSILTTSKDFVRIPTEFLNRVEILEIELELDYQQIVEYFCDHIQNYPPS